MLTVRQRMRTRPFARQKLMLAQNGTEEGRLSGLERRVISLLKSLGKCQTPQIRIDIEPIQETDSSIVIGTRRLGAPLGE